MKFLIVMMMMVVTTMMIYYCDCVFLYWPPIPKCLLCKEGQRLIRFVFSVSRTMCSTRSDFAMPSKGELATSRHFLLPQLVGGHWDVVGCCYTSCSAQGRHPSVNNYSVRNVISVEVARRWSRTIMDSNRCAKILWNE